jgi:hypothetical protein
MSQTGRYIMSSTVKVSTGPNLLNLSWLTRPHGQNLRMASSDEATIAKFSDQVFAPVRELDAPKDTVPGSGVPVHPALHPRWMVVNP